MEGNTLMVKKYRPSNGTEGDCFQAEFCEKCTKDNFDHDTGDGGCEILADVYCFSITDESYPKEWIYDDDGQPTCTAFTTENQPTKADIAYLEWKAAR